MVVDVVLYLAVHQPRRFKLPAQPIPRCASIEDITRCLFDERLNERYFRQVAQSCYYPAARLFLQQVRQQKLRLALGISLSFVRQAILWEPALLDLFRELAEEEAVELVGIDPYRSLHALLDLPTFVMRLRWMAEELEQVFGKRPRMIDTADLGMSTSIYHALDAAGFQGAMMESSPQVMQWRSSTYLYRADDEEVCTSEIKLAQRARRSTAKMSERDRLGPPYTVEGPGTNAPYLLTRHAGLNADISARFSNTTWSYHPLYADVYARWIAQAEGDYVLLGWDLENFGERHAQASGIFEFMQAFPRELEQLGVTTRTPGELIERLAGSRAYHLPLPRHSATWASFTNPDLYFEHEEQRVLFQFMHDVYNLARLTENPELLDLAIWLAQADTLRHLQWPGPQLATAVIPQEWGRLGAAGLLHEQKQVYLNALHAFAAYLPSRVLRQNNRSKGPATRAPDSPDSASKGPSKTSRLKNAPAEQETSVSNEPPQTPRRKGSSSEEVPKPSRRKNAPAQQASNVIAQRK